MTTSRWTSGAVMLREVAALARQGWLLPQVGRPLREHGPAEHLVVFVHGYFASGGVFEPLAQRLAERGVAPRQLHFTYAPAGSVARHAEALRRSIERAQPRGPVCIVAHSLGGLIARHYAQVLGGRLDALVALATPHRGTPKAEGWPLTLAQELSPGSGTLRTLDCTRARLWSARLTSVVAEGDVVVPPASAVLEGSRVVRIANVGHHGVLFHPEAWQAVEEGIDVGGRRVRHAEFGARNGDPDGARNGDPDGALDDAQALAG